MRNWTPAPFSALLLLPLTACGSCGPGGAGTDSGDDTGSEVDGTTVPCTEVDPASFAVHVIPSPMPTVATVEWTVQGGVDTWMRFSESGHDPVNTPVLSNATGLQQEYLLGVPGNAIVNLQILVDDGELTTCTPAQEFRTEGLFPNLPQLNLRTPLPDEVAPGFLVTTVFSDPEVFAVIINSEGRYVWAAPASQSSRRLRRAIAGDSLVLNEEAMSTTEFGQIVRLAFTGGQIRSTPVLALHTDYVEVEPDTFVGLSWDDRTIEGIDVPVLADTVIEVNGSGTLTELWNAWDHLDFDAAAEWEGETFPGDDPHVDWTHANGISYDEATDSILVSLGNLGAVVNIDRSTGEQRWVLGGPESDFAIAEGTIDFPHSVQAVDDNRLVIFNRNEIGVGCSEAIEIELDFENWTASEVWHYQSEECLSVYYLGLSERLPNGNTMTVFSTAGQIDQATPDGDLAWRVFTNLGAAFGFAQYRESLYQ